MVSSPDSRFHSNVPQAAGLKNFRLYYGAYRLLPTGQQAARHSSWSMVQKLSYQVIFIMTLHGLLHIVEADNEAACQDSHDALEEERDLAASRSAIYQQDL